MDFWFSLLISRIPDIPQAKALTKAEYRAPWSLPKV